MTTRYKMTWIIIRLAALLIIINGATVFAQTQTSKQALAEEYMKVIKFKEQMEKMMGPIPKEDKEAIKFRDDYLSQAYENGIKLYEETYTEDELKFLISFHKSPLLFTKPKDTEKFMALTKKLMAKVPAHGKETQSKRPPLVGTPYMRAKKVSQRNECINNLRQIDAAKEQYALENGLTNNAPMAFSNIFPTAKNNDRYYLKEYPVCPNSTNANAKIRTRGMTENDYDINVVGSSPKCRIHPKSHVLPSLP